MSHYLAEGLLGDFIIQLSVVCEKFHKTGKKGIVHMVGTNFRNGIQETYDDIVSIVKSQYYIEDLRTDLPENFDNIIHLSSWRNNDQLFKINMYDLFLREYEIELGKHAWITTNVDAQWSSKILVHITQYRFPNNIDFACIVREHGIDNFVFLNMDNGDFDFFVSRTGVTIPNVYKPTSFVELCTMINSCTMFIGSPSMPLCIANASHAKRIVGLPANTNDIKMIQGLINHIPNIVAEI